MGETGHRWSVLILLNAVSLRSCAGAVCAPSHPPLARRLQELYETAYTQINGVYHPCLPEVCGPLTEVSCPNLGNGLRLMRSLGGEDPDRRSTTGSRGWGEALSETDLLLGGLSPTRPPSHDSCLHVDDSLRETLSYLGPLARHWEASRSIGSKMDTCSPCHIASFEGCSNSRPVSSPFRLIIPFENHSKWKPTRYIMSSSYSTRVNLSRRV